MTWYSIWLRWNIKPDFVLKKHTKLPLSPGNLLISSENILFDCAYKCQIICSNLLCGRSLDMKLHSTDGQWPKTGLYGISPLCQALSTVALVYTYSELIIVKEPEIPKHFILHGNLTFFIIMGCICQKWYLLQFLSYVICHRNISHMMMSWHESAFCITCPLYRESTGGPRLT